MHHRRSPPPPTCVTGLVDFEYTLLLSHCCEDILGSGHLLQGHVSHVSIAEFYPCSPFYYYAHFFSSTSMSFYLLAMLSNGRLFFRLYFIVNLSFNKFFFPCHLMILFCSNYLKTSHSQYILCIKIFGHFEISNKSLLSFSYQSSFKITYTWLVLHMYCILSITITCFSSCLFFWIKNVKGKDMLSQREYKILIMLSFRRFECVSMLYALNLWYAISIFELEKACFSWNGKFYSIFKGAKMTVIRKKLYNFFKILFWGLTRRIDIFGFISTLGAVYLRTWLIL